MRNPRETTRIVLSRAERRHGTELGGDGQQSDLDLGGQLTPRIEAQLTVRASQGSARTGQSAFVRGRGSEEASILRRGEKQGQEMGRRNSQVQV